MADLLLQAESANRNAAPAAIPVNPATFLEYFAANGGGYCITPDGQLWLGILQTNTAEVDRKLATQLLRLLSPDDTRRIRDHIVGLGAAQTAPAIPHPDAEILAAWDRHVAGCARINCESEVDGSPAIEAARADVDAADKLIQGTLAKTPQGVAIQIWTALHNSSAYTTLEEQAILQRDLDYVEKNSRDFDWDALPMIAALRSLRAMEA